MLKILNVKYKAATLVETLAALSLITLAFGISMAIHAQVTGGSGLRSKSRALPILQSTMRQTIEQADFSDKTLDVEGLEVVREVRPYPNYTKVYHIRMTAVYKGGEIMSINRLIHHNPTK